ncbi:AAA family ATPase [Pseudoflavitalea sp. X16]|uniref:AAA family ATPase n=1 Tax=Paraflavitalea devenefica TaxID=2716334 RepID=UPI00141F8ACB|nr:AAA family ATPase [Paraflavitalea devenefica]NII26275.1 AAA family ATPase [Paraflavitalea devenefica]
MTDSISAIREDQNDSPVPDNGTAVPSATTIWQELDTWAQNFRPWQRYILGRIIHSGRIADAEIEQAYQLFLRDYNLASSPIDIEVPQVITGRPATASPVPVLLVGIRALRSVNALPPTFELTFSNGLTVIYGRNGAGKSGVVRVLSNICFSRMQHTVLPNIYDDSIDQPRPSAEIIMNTGSGNQQVTFIIGDNTANTELKRISIFDTPVARNHLVEQGPLRFRPAGFDVFPEMARAYGLLSTRLATDITGKTKENTFARSFIGPVSPVSTFITSLSANTDLTVLRNLAAFGDMERARLEEVQRQIRELQSQSVAGAIIQLQGAKRDINLLINNLQQSSALLTEEKRVEYRAQLNDFITKAKAVAENGAGSFSTDFFKSIGTTQWEAFLSAAQALANTESTNYPQEQDHCLLCHRPLGEASINLIKRFWGFLASDAKRQMEQASAVIDGTVRAIEAVNLEFFSESTTVRDHVERLNPVLSRQTTELLQTLQADRDTIIQVLQTGAGEIPTAAFIDLTDSYTALTTQIDTDIARLREQTAEAALQALEAERINLEHKQVLNQLLPDIEIYINDLEWIREVSDVPKRSLNPRPITDKETQLSSSLIAEGYQERFSQECELLECDLPVEFRTQGSRGQTVKSLSMKGGHSPERVLSEGEQRAIALADFLTEVALNPANAGIIVDDPVTSQDHDRKEKIAERLVNESKVRQVIIFTHDLVFLNMLVAAAKEAHVGILTHWVHRDSTGRPGVVSLDDSPDLTPQYRNTQKAASTLVEANAATGSEQEKLIRRGMSELRRTIEEVVPHYLFKEVIKRWTDRVLVTSLKRINWDHTLVQEIESIYEELSAIIEGHTHTEERAGAPPEPRHLEAMITRVNEIIGKARRERQNN